jgi:hypothetical protein
VSKLILLNYVISILALFFSSFTFSQLVINEGSNKNYTVLADEDGDYEDWIEIFNAGSSPIDLFNYSLSDNSTPGEWFFPHQIIQPNEYITVFCSEKNRYFSSPFSTVLYDSIFSVQTGWSNHSFSSPFYWDGISNIILSVCSYSDYWTNNSVHAQTATAYNSTTLAGGEAGAASACNYPNGWTVVSQRPNLRLNNVIIDNGTIQNSPFDYPAPYGNWYWTSKHQILLRGNELQSAGLSAGFIDSLAFEIVAPDPASYNYIELSLASTGLNEMTTRFIPNGGNFNHTNFKISSTGETIKLYNPSGTMVSALNVNCGPGYDVSIGHFLDASGALKRFSSPTPGVSNNNSIPSDGYAAAPVFSINSGIYTRPK